MVRPGRTRCRGVRARRSACSLRAGRGESASGCSSSWIISAPRRSWSRCGRSRRLCVLGGGRRWLSAAPLAWSCSSCFPAVLGYGVAAGRGSTTRSTEAWPSDARATRSVPTSALVVSRTRPTTSPGSLGICLAACPAVVLRPYPVGGRRVTRTQPCPPREPLAWYPLIALSLLRPHRAWPSRRGARVPRARLGGFAARVRERSRATSARRSATVAELVWGVALLAALGMQTLVSRSRPHGERFPSDAERASTLAGEHGA